MTKEPVEGKRKPKKKTGSDRKSAPKSKQIDKKGVLIISGCVLGLAALAAIVILVFGKPSVSPSVSFGFKTTDGPGIFDESITSFEVGKKFYTCITVKMVTDKEKISDYRVVLDIPKTREVEVKGMGGLEPDSIVWNEAEQSTRMIFTVQGHKAATAEKLLFYGTPVDEGQAKMMIHVFDKNGNEINKGYSRTLFFEYNIQ